MMMLTSMGAVFESLTNTLQDCDPEAFKDAAFDERADLMASLLRGQKILGVLLTHASKEMASDEIADAGWLMVGLAEVARVWHDKAQTS